MTPEQMREAASAAAKWWASKLPGGSENTTAPSDEYGETDERRGAMTDVLVGNIRSATQVTQAQRDIFKEEIERIILNQLVFDEEHGGDPLVYIGVDYGPDDELREALACAGIPEDEILPYKSRTKITETRAVARAGRGGKEETIWTTRTEVNDE